MICERHGVLKRSCEICSLEDDIKQLKSALEQICETSGNSTFHTFTREGHQKCIEIAEIVLDQF